MAQKPLDKEVAHRFAELVGQGLTQHEAARAVEIGTRTGERLMTKPEIRQIVKETRAASGIGNGDPVIWGLLKATDEEGNPDLERRAQGVELALEHLASLAPEGGRGRSLPEGAPIAQAAYGAPVMSLFGSSATIKSRRLPPIEKMEFVRAQRGTPMGKGVGASSALHADSVEELRLATGVMCSPGLEVELELAEPLPLTRSVGDDHLDHVILDLVGNAAPAVEEVP